MTTKPFAFKSSKLSSAADQLWSASKSGFKADEKNIRLDLGKTLIKNKPEKVTMPEIDTAKFIFGSKLSEKVIINKDDQAESSDSGGSNSSSKSKERFVSNIQSRNDDAPKSVSAVFEEIKQKSATSSFIASSKTKESKTESETVHASSSLTKEEKKAAAPVDKDIAKSPKLDEIEVVTGEEGETNIYRTTCKLHSFDITSKAWTERGLTSLHINERGESPSFTYRIVGRVMGNQRVILNSQIFPDMIVEKVSSKRVKFSATTPDSEVPVLFLATASEFVTAQLYGTLLRIVEDRKREVVRKRKISDNVAEEEGTEEEESESVSPKKIAAGN